MCAKAEDGTHTLMKGDEIVEGAKILPYALLFGFVHGKSKLGFEEIIW